jgi:hypothetical protein
MVMKKFIFISLAIIAALFINFYAFADSISSGEQTSSGAIIKGPAILKGAMLISNASSDPKIILYDNSAAASGTVISEISFDISVSGDLVKYVPFPDVTCYDGLYVTASGTGASYVIYYEHR